MAPLDAAVDFTLGKDYFILGTHYGKTRGRTWRLKCLVPSKSTYFAVRGLQMVSNERLEFLE